MAAFIALRTIIDSLSAEPTLQAVAVRVGREIETELRLGNLAERDADRYAMTKRWIAGHKSRKYRGTVLRYAYGKSETVNFEPWPSVTPLVPSLDPADYAYKTPALAGGGNVKAALDELLRLSTPRAEPGWQLFESSGSFTVPSGVTEVLVLSIGAGGKGMDCPITQTYAASGGVGAYAVSKYIPVDADQSISVRIGSASGVVAGTNIFNGETLQATSSDLICSKKAGNGGQGYINTYGTPIGSLISLGGGAGGGFLISSEVEDIRSAWLAVALDTAGDGLPANGGNASKTMRGEGGACWPDTSRRGTDGMTSMGGSAAGSYGGGGGGAPQKNGSGPGGPGGKAALMIFWGPDIRPETSTPAA